MESVHTPIIFTPDNEPYLGRLLLYHLDQIIIATVELNAKKVPLSYGQRLDNHQKMACQLIAQSLHLTLSIRELLREQGSLRLQIARSCDRVAAGTWI
ncbi:hypothetical protein AL065_12930 [Pseudomonas amygdali pv. ulmi]|uniref:hypothetical protein n=1 Tax=Pseudomonas amygdali TaxID=47877 RepID=UPI000760A333|nr:hypothetical protein [Pseudomonas amygdali]KWS34970.1 hypothetical protein AL065_12930 [Pseudomonas amygdali pv. ulmi]